MAKEDFFYHLCAKISFIMSEGIKNRGSKGYFILFLFVSFVLFLTLVIGVYQANFKFIG